MQSGVVPRWVVIGWLLKCCRRNYFEANAKLALFFDWLFFDERVDNIMNIEPAMLLMVHSLPKYADFTCTLMEFLFILVDNYDVQRKDMIFRGVLAAFNASVRKGVVHSLEPLTSCELISPVLRNRLSMFISNLNPGAVREPSVLRAPEASKESHKPTMLESNKELDITSKSGAMKSHMLHESENIREPFTSSESEAVKDPSVFAQTGDVTELMVPISSEVASPTKLQNSVTMGKCGFGLIDNLVSSLGSSIEQSSIEQSKECGLRALKTLLILFIKLDAQALNGGSIGSFSVWYKEFAREISKAFESVGYEMLLPLSSQKIEVECDDEVHSATALVLQAYVFHPLEKTRDMIAFWLEEGHPVSTHPVLCI